MDKHIQADTIVVTDVDRDSITYVCGGIVYHDEYGPTSPFTITRHQWMSMVRAKTLHEPRSTPDWAGLNGGTR